MCPYTQCLNSMQDSDDAMPAPRSVCALGANTDCKYARAVTWDWQKPGKWCDSACLKAWLPRGLQPGLLAGWQP